jgi:hypothetical protein
MKICKNSLTFFVNISQDYKISQHTSETSRHTGWESLVYMLIFSPEVYATDSDPNDDYTTHCLQYSNKGAALINNLNFCKT